MAHGRLFRIWYSGVDNRYEIGRAYVVGSTEKLSDDSEVWELVDKFISEVILEPNGEVERYDLAEYMINNCADCTENYACGDEWDCATSWVYAEEMEDFDEKDIEFNDIFGYTWTWILNVDDGTWKKMENWNQMMVNKLKVIEHGNVKNI